MLLRALRAATPSSTILRTFPWPPEDLRELILDQDAICVSGGNTANMLAIWRVHGIDELLREAWENGVVLFGASAGMICWFEAGVTDSFGPQLDGMDCLGLLAGSACPHYDGEELRRPRYRELVDGGVPGGDRRRRRRRRCTTSAPSCARSSRAGPGRRPIASRATARRRWPRASSARSTDAAPAGERARSASSL